MGYERGNMYQVTVFISDNVYIYHKLTGRQVAKVVGSAIALADHFQVRRYES